MATVNNFKGYCLARPVNPDGVESELSDVIGKKRVEWHTLEPMVIYPKLEQLIEATPSFNKKTDFICEVIVHLTGERVEIVSVP